MILTGTSRLYDLVRGRVLTGTPDAPLAVPPGAVVVPGTRALAGRSPRSTGCRSRSRCWSRTATPGTDARVALEEALR